MRSAALLFLCALLTACSTLPDIPEPETAVPATDTYPTFVPIAEVALLTSDDADSKNLETEEALAARIAGLKARAGRLRRAQVE